MSKLLLVLGVIAVAIFALAVALPTAAEATPTPTPTSTPCATVWLDMPPEVDEGGSFTAWVNVTWMNIFALGQYDLSYDPSVVELTNVASGKIKNKTVAVDMWGLQPPGEQGRVRVLLNVEGTAGVTGAGYLSSLSFDVVGSPCDTSGMAFSNGSLIRADLSDITAVWQDGSMHIQVQPTPTPTQFPGDANGDGQRSAGDITQIELCIIDPLTYPPASYPGADANEDSAMNMVDVGVVEYMILNAWPFDHVYIEAAGEVSAGSNFSATLYITRVEHFDSAGYNVTYDPDVLQVTRVTAGSIVPLGSPNWTQIPVDSWGLSGGVQGEVRVTNDVPGAPGINGTGYLSRIHFHVNGSACETSNISFSGGCVLQDMWGSNISATWDGDSLHVSP